MKHKTIKHKAGKPFYFEEYERYELQELAIAKARAVERDMFYRIEHPRGYYEAQLVHLNAIINKLSAYPTPLPPKKFARILPTHKPAKSSGKSKQRA